MSREVCGSCGAVLGAPEPAEGRPKGAAVRVGQAFAYVTVGALALVIVISLVAAAYALVTAVWA